MKTKERISIQESLELAKIASRKLANLNSEARNKALLKMADQIDKRKEELLDANRKDLAKAEKLLEDGSSSITEAMISRLKLTESKIKDIVKGIRDVAALPDPLGVITRATELDKKLDLYRVTTPIGVLAVIFESRPDALPQIASLCLKTGNAVLLKGGREAENSLRVLFQCLTDAATKSGVPENAFSLLNTREDVALILKADGLVDLIIPRGSNSLVRHIQDNTRIPVLGHADGICHLYIHKDADFDKAEDLVVDSKTQYPSACNALETLLINKSVLPEILPRVAKALSKQKVELRLDDTAGDYLSYSNSNVDYVKAKESDWAEEYCDLILSVKIVETIEEAIEHINKYGSGHTDAIVTKSKKTFETFFNSVNSAGVFWNASTRFADGYRYGFGAEVGIATGKLHPRGPVGLDGLVTYKYRLEGEGQTVAEYSGENAKTFSHKPIEVD